jgi:hypothetical protein
MKLENLEITITEKNTLLELVRNELYVIRRLISEYPEDSENEELNQLELTESELEKLYKKIKGK